MISTLAADAAARPALLRFFGGAGRADVERWVHERGYLVPLEVIELWQDTGGGDLFESEELLVPVKQTALPYGTVDERTEQWRQRGLPSWVVLFHEGAWVSGVDQRTGELIAFEPSNLSEYGRYANLDDWYRGTLRAEFAERYGLT